MGCAGSRPGKGITQEQQAITKLLSSLDVAMDGISTGLEHLVEKDSTAMPVIRLRFTNQEVKQLNAIFGKHASASIAVGYHMGEASGE